MSKLTIAPTPTERNDLPYHEVMLALSKARAAWWLLTQIHGDHLDPPDETTREWLTGIGLEIIGTELEGATMAYQKIADLVPFERGVA